MHYRIKTISGLQLFNKTLITQRGNLKNRCVEFTMRRREMWIELLAPPQVSFVCISY